MSGALLVPMKRVSNENRKEYEPGRVEKEILAHVSGEWQECKGQMSHLYAKWQIIRDMAVGRYVRDSTDSSSYASMYIPFIAKDHEIAVALQILRLIPNSQTMDFLELQRVSALSDSHRGDVSERMGVTPEGATGELSKVMSVALRNELGRSNLMTALEEMALYSERYGFAVGFAEPRMKTEELPAMDVFSDDPKAMMRGHVDEFGDMVFVEEGIYDVEQPDGSTRQFICVPIFDGLKFVAVNPSNLVLPDLYNDSGVTGLDWFGVYSRRTFREVLSNELMIRDGKRAYGHYANVEYLRPTDQDLHPSLQMDGASDFDEFSGGYESSNVGETTRVPTKSSFAVPARLGRFFMEDVPGLLSDPPTKVELEKFRKKFGFSQSDFHKDQPWVIEWVEDKNVLVRFEPWSLPVDAVTGSIAVEVRKTKIEGETVGAGDYALGGGDLEILANGFLQNSMEQDNRISRPMYGIVTSMIDKDQRKKDGDTLTYSPDRVLRLSAAAIGAKNLLVEIGPSKTAANKGHEGYSFCKGELQDITGVTGQVKGSGSGGATATESITKKNYLEQLIFSDNRALEDGVLRPMLRMGLAVLVQVIAQSGANFRVTASGRDMELWAEKYPGAESLEVDLTPEDVMGEWSLNILTTGAKGDADGRMVRVEKLLGLLLQAQPVLQASGTIADYKYLLSEYADAQSLSSARVFPQPGTIDNSDFLQEAGQAQMMGAAGQPVGGAAGIGTNPNRGGSDGGAGKPRPGAQRRLTELASPGEPVAGGGAGPVQLQRQMGA